jgi:hypothetical protein
MKIVTAVFAPCKCCVTFCGGMKEEVKAIPARPWKYRKESMMSNEQMALETKRGQKGRS